MSGVLRVAHTPEALRAVCEQHGVLRPSQLPGRRTGGGTSFGKTTRWGPWHDQLPPAEGELALVWSDEPLTPGQAWAPHTIIVSLAEMWRWALADVPPLRKAVEVPSWITRRAQLQYLTNIVDPYDDPLTEMTISDDGTYLDIQTDEFGIRHLMLALLVDWAACPVMMPEVRAHATSLAQQLTTPRISASAASGHVRQRTLTSGQ